MKFTQVYTIALALSSVLFKCIFPEAGWNENISGFARERAHNRAEGVFFMFRLLGP